MATGMGADSIQRKREQRKLGGAKYPRLNLQSGDKTQQDFCVKPLPRIAAESAECKEAMYEYFVHRNCGPDNDATLVCPNRTEAEKTANTNKCPICSYTKKILRNQTEYTENVIKLTKDKTPRERVNWPVLDLYNPKEVQMLEVSGQALEEILDAFEDQAGQTLDLSDLSQACALRIRRNGSGFTSKYSYKALVGPEFAMGEGHIQILKNTYITPESVVERLDPEVLAQRFTGEFGTTADPGDYHGVPGVGMGQPASASALSALDQPGVVPVAPVAPVAQPVAPLPLPAQAPLGPTLAPPVAPGVAIEAGIAALPVAPAPVAPVRTRPAAVPVAPVAVVAPVAPIQAAPIVPAPQIQAAPPIQPAPVVAQPVAVAPVAVVAPVAPVAPVVPTAGAIDILAELESM